MKEIVEKMNAKNIVCKSLHVIIPKEIGSRKKIEIYVENPIISGKSP